MHISSLRLQNFRSYIDREFTFDPSVTIISGPNGSGKTNILEAIHVVSTGKSFRDGDDELTRYDQPWWKLQGGFDTGQREVRYQDGVKSLIIEDGEHKRFSKSHRIPVVLFEPDDLYLIHGSPGARRKYIDAVITAVTPGYATTLRRYERALAQRNRLLKSPRAVDEDELFVWDIMLAEQAELIVTRRKDLVSRWSAELSTSYSTIADTSSVVTARYHTVISGDHYKQSILNHLKAASTHDRLTGSTSVGPHRDDIEFFLDGKSCVSSASRGEIRSLVLSLKRSEIHSLVRYYDTKPLLLMDDVLSELDNNRQRNILGIGEGYQTILTTTHQHPEINSLHLDLGSS